MIYPRGKSHQNLTFCGGFKALRTKERRALPMYVTYQDLIQIGILIVALANLIYQVYKEKRNSRHYCQQ